MYQEILGIDLVKEMGLEKLPEEKREKMIGQMATIVEHRLNRTVMSKLTEDEIEELDKLLDADGNTESFLNGRDPDLQGIAKQILYDFKKEMLDMKIQAEQAWKDAKGNTR